MYPIVYLVEHTQVTGAPVFSRSPESRSAKRKMPPRGWLRRWQAQT